MNTDPMIRVPFTSTRQRAPSLVPLRAKSSGATDTGRHRHNNEDCLLIAPIGRNGNLFAVADGMGGAKGGEVASALALGVVEALLVPALSVDRPVERGWIMDELRHVIGRADGRVVGEAMQRPELDGMGTTLTIAYAVGRDLFVGHVGDSRVYLRHNASFRALTSDHTLAGELVRYGVVPHERAAEHGLRHVLTNAIGANASPPHVELHHAELAPGDALLLCTDGLTEMLTDEAIEATLAVTRDPARATKTLIARANEMGGHDNVTAIVAYYEAAM